MISSLMWIIYPFITSHVSILGKHGSIGLAMKSSMMLSTYMYIKYNPILLDHRLFALHPRLRVLMTLDYFCTGLRIRGVSMV
jgi:hypothetical protein